MDSPARRILIVDDDAGLLRVIANYLARVGYQVDTCSRAAEACALVEANPSIYTRALVDLNMPDMRGEEVARRILDADASIRVLVMSGYPAGTGGPAALNGRVDFLPKPFTPGELAAALAHIP